MAKTFLSVAVMFFALVTVLASAAKSAPETEIVNQNSTISTVQLLTDRAVAENIVDAEARPTDELKAPRNVGCKKFFPTVGMTLSVPCDAAHPTPTVATETPPPEIEEDSQPITEETPAINEESTSRRKDSRPIKKNRKRRASVGSCSGCRNSCYVRYRVRTHSRRFVPCMRRCWYRACR